MTTRDSERFRSLPPMLVGDFTDPAARRKMNLLMLHHTPAGDGLLFPVEFVRGELEYRTQGQKDAVLHGVARMADEDGDFQPARILFSQYHKTASLKGLSLEGSVKFA